MRLIILTLRHKAIAKLFFISVLSLFLPSCANGNSGTFLESIVAPDAQLQPSSGLDLTDTLPGSPCADATLSQLPNGFPRTLCYSGALFLGSEMLQDANQNGGELAGKSDSNKLRPGEILQTQWKTNQSIETVQQFYQTFFDEGEWQVTRLPHELGHAGIFQALKGSARITIRFSNFSTHWSAQPSSEDSELISISKIQPIQYTLDYRESAIFKRASAEDVTQDSGQKLGANASNLTNERVANPELSETALEDVEGIDRNVNLPGDLRVPEIIGLDDVPSEIKDYVEAFIALGVVVIEENENPSRSESGEDENLTLTSLRPNEPITRREFARWLVQANNRFYEGQPNRQIRLASPLSEPAFEDIGQADSDFRTIQGLAEAGLIPSQLSSDAETDNPLFRADAPLTRETLIAWKLPLDVRKGLPTVTVETIQDTWGFQDSTKITPSTLSAIVADYQNGDRANLRRAFGYTLLFQPQKSVTRAEAAAALWYFGTEDDGISATDILERQSDNDQSLNDQPE